MEGRIQPSLKFCCKSFAWWCSPWPNT